MMHDNLSETNIDGSNNTVFLNKTNQINSVNQTLDIHNDDNSIVLMNHPKRTKHKSFLKRNKNYGYMPKFYIHEYKRFMMLFVLWLVINIIIVSLSSLSCVMIVNNANISNWTMLTLLPIVLVAISFLIIYTNNFIDFRNEARNVDFSQEKVITINIKKLYKRLKTGYMNINWFCLLSYILSGLTILIVYLVAWAMTFKWDGGPKWGVLNNARLPYNPLFLVIVICAITWMFCTFILHISLLVSCHIRANKIDHFYSVQIVSNDEIDMLKKKKNRRNAIIVIAIIATIVLFGIYIYKIIKTKKTNNINVYTK